MTADEREQLYLVARTLRVAYHALEEVLPTSDELGVADLNIDVRGAIGHLSVAIGETETVMEHLVGGEGNGDA